MASTNRRTLPILSKYEKARLLANRAVDIADGKPITIPNPGTTNPLEIAHLELNAGKSPIIVRREFPDGHVDTFLISELVRFD